MSALDGEHVPLAERLGDETHNVLLLAPPMDDRAEEACTGLLTVDRPSTENVLHVTFVHSPDERLRTWETHVGPERPAKTGFVTVGDATRSSAGVATNGSAPGSGPTIKTVSTPGNLTDLGIQVSAFLTEWTGDDERTVICFHSLTTMLQYVDLQRAFRFLHVLTGRVRSTGGFAHYHMDPDAHDPRTQNTVKTLFDGVVEWTDGGWTVRNR